MLRPRRRRSCFQDRCSKLISACLPAFDFKSQISNLKSEAWLPDLDSHQDKRLNRPPCYFDTTWQFEIGAAGRTLTCIVPFRRRMPHMFGHGSNLNWSARQDLHLRSLGPRPSMLLLHHALLPRRMVGAGGLVLVEMEAAHLGSAIPSEIWRTRRDLHPQPSRRQRVAPLIELRIRNGGRYW